MNDNFIYQIYHFITIFRAVSTDLIPFFAPGEAAFTGTMGRDEPRCFRAAEHHGGNPIHFASLLGDRKWLSQHCEGDVGGESPGDWMLINRWLTGEQNRWAKQVMKTGDENRWLTGDSPVFPEKSSSITCNSNWCFFFLIWKNHLWTVRGMKPPEMGWCTTWRHAKLAELSQLCSKCVS